MEDTFISHKGMHVNTTEMLFWKQKMEDLQIGIAQEVWTISHNNPAIKGKRKYHYVVFDSISKLGYDLKLIERIII